MSPLAAAGIDVIVGVSAKMRNVVEQFKSGSLSSTQDQAMNRQLQEIHVTAGQGNHASALQGESQSAPAMPAHAVDP
jgi:predicted Fe-Mo cluster-binding NifX family protein